MTKYLYLPLIPFFLGCVQRTKIIKNTPLLPKKEIIVPQKDSLPTIDSLAKYYSYSSGEIDSKILKRLSMRLFNVTTKRILLR